MSSTNEDFYGRAIELVRRLWHLYIFNLEPEELDEAIQGLPHDFLMFGTGRHELYKNLNEFVAGITADQVEARGTQFELLDEWYEAQGITDGVCTVYGSIWVREKPAPGKAVLVDMEGSRFTVICRDTANGAQICSIHHSMPYQDQGEDEYYPKSLASLANEAVQRSEVLERQVELDYMTELYNRVHMELHISRVLKGEAGYYFSLDLDDFKSVNDTKGHLAGDKVIREFAELLRRVFGPGAILGRMGGDEFAAWDGGIGDQAAADVRFSALIEGCQALSDEVGVPISCSAGIALSRRTGEDFTALYQRADKALYRAKAGGKGRLAWA